MNATLKIACLPIAGRENPYQYLMIDGLNESPQIEAFNGFDSKFFGIFMTAIKYKTDFIHFDWITSYYERRKLWMTLLLLPLFYLQIYYVKIFTKTKLVWTLHNITPHNAKDLWLHKKVRRFFASKMTWIRVFAKNSVERAVNELMISEEKLKVIPEGSYTAEYPNTITSVEARKVLEINQSKTVLLSLGYIKPYKGLENLIIQFSSIEKEDVVLLMAGQNMDTKYLQSLKKMISDKKETRIHLIADFIPIEKLQVYFNTADAIVLPFDKVENSGSAIMAMGFKKAILAPKMGVLTERLKRQDFLLYQDLFTGLNSIFALHKDELERIGLQNFESLKKYTWKDFAQAFK